MKTCTLFVVISLFFIIGILPNHTYKIITSELQADEPSTPPVRPTPVRPTIPVRETNGTRRGNV